MKESRRAELEREMCMDTMLEIRNLTKQYRDFTLDSVSFSVPGGSIMGFVGENGAGKTTTLKLILDEMPRDGGSVSVFGKDNIREGEAVRQEIGVVFDECCFREQFTPKNIGSILKSCYRGWDTAYYRSLLQRFSLPQEKPVKVFSRGMKMKLSLAAALAHRPRLLLLDEATAGLDPAARDEILELFQEFVSDEDHAVLFSSHMTEDLEKIADSVTYLHNGRILFSEWKDTLIDRWGVIRCGPSDLGRLDPEDRLAVRRGTFEASALTHDREAAARKYRGMVVDRATLEEIMVLYGRGDQA